LRRDGSLGWRDQVAEVSIAAVGPSGHSRRGLMTIGARMVVVPRTVLERFVAATRADRRREVQLEPVEFPTANVLIPHRMYGRLGRAYNSITTGKVTSGTSGCYGCDHPELVWGWREGGTMYTLVLTPLNTIVVPGPGVRVERRYDPTNGSDVVLLTTERSEDPHFLIGVPHPRLHRWKIQEHVL
jgi:hypothetical protein